MVSRLPGLPSDCTQPWPAGHTPLQIGAPLSSHATSVGHSLLQFKWTCWPTAFLRVFSASEATSLQSLSTSHDSSRQSSDPSAERRMNRASDAFGELSEPFTGWPHCLALAACAVSVNKIVAM